MSERRFQPTGRLQYPDTGDIYCRPNPDLVNIADIFEYALTFDGYPYAKEQFHRHCGDLANERLGAYRRSGVWDGTFEELRCCLFFEQRRWRQFERDPEGEDLAGIIALHSAICQRWHPDLRNGGRTSS